eukprot:Hpha_TRINITY_DN15313_c3_g5::TRINITY_DN15313_c3_g5_i1::g.90195::m.90195
MPLEFTEAGIEAAIATALADGKIKEGKKGEKTYYYDKSKKVLSETCYRKDLAKHIRPWMDKQVTKKAEAALKEGKWKKHTKGDKTWYALGSDKKTVVWNLEQVIAEELGWEVVAKKKDK